MRCLLLASLLAVALPGVAEASCPACATGTPSLGTPGSEIPFDGRLRFAATVRAREVRYDGVTLREGRLDLAASYAPLAELTLTASVPLVVHAGDDGSSASGVGNAGASARLVVLRDRTLAPHHVLSVLCGGLLPAPAAPTTGNGDIPPLALATGVSTFGATAGVSYVAMDGNLSLATTVSGVAWLDGPGLRRTGPSLLGTVAGQWHVTENIALRAVVDARVDATSKGGLGRVDPDSCGFVLSAGPEALFGFSHWLFLVVGARVPVVQEGTGKRVEGLTLSATLVLDV